MKQTTYLDLFGNYLAAYILMSLAQYVLTLLFQSVLLSLQLGEAEGPLVLALPGFLLALFAIFELKNEENSTPLAVFMIITSVLSNFLIDPRTDSFSRMYLINMLVAAPVWTIYVLGYAHLKTNADYVRFKVSIV